MPGAGARLLPVRAEASVRPISQPRRSALLPLTATGSPTLPIVVVKPESEVSWSFGKSSRFRSRKAHHSSSHSAVWCRCR